LLPSVESPHASAFVKADKLSYEVIGAAIEVHRHKGPGLIESIYEKCILRELELRHISCVSQKTVLIEDKGYTFKEPQMASAA
jgi:GxxExxY protein